MTGIFPSLSGVLPDEYPLPAKPGPICRTSSGSAGYWTTGSSRRRLRQPYEWSAHGLAAPGLLDCIDDGALTYAWPAQERDVWRPPASLLIQLAHRALPPAR